MEGYHKPFGIYRQFRIAPSTLEQENSTLLALNELTNRCAIKILASNIDRNKMVHVIDRDRSGTGSSRTTNALEAFHHTFNSLLTCQHPTIWKLLESLESQQNLSRSTIFKIGRGDSFRPSVQERRRNERIQNLVVSYTQATADNLLRGIAYIII